jgi:hypothetical protein
MNTRAGVVLAGAAILGLWGASVPAGAQELSEHAVRSFMEYAWSLTPQQFSKPDGSVIVIDKNKKSEVEVPLDVARDVIKVGRLSAHAQICDLRDDQVLNHRALMRREEARKRWTPQQLVYISQLHLTTVMLMTGRIKLVEQEGDKQVVVDEKKRPPQTCSEEQRGKIKELIASYVAASPAPNVAAAARPPAAAGKRPGAAPGSPPGAPVSTGSTSLSETTIDKK